jgi:hypothetical protein
MITIKQAREVIREAFEVCPDFRNGYKTNIAMCIYDAQDTNNYSADLLDLKTMGGCNDMADRLLKIIFEEGF